MPEAARCVGRGKVRFEEKLGHIVRSSLEFDFCVDLLDFYHEKYLYEPKAFRVELKNNDSRSYRPDIYIPRLNLYIELKGFILSEKDTEKTFAFRDQYPEYNYSFIMGKDYYKIRKNLPESIEEFIDTITTKETKQQTLT